jgi:flagellar hook protein FlgE
MPFNVALSGLKASQVDLEVTGNNIANASTVGFKRSRTEFGDLYSNSFLSAGNNAIGDGVQVANVRQIFAQGNLSFTDQGLDMAINGNGFYVVEDRGLPKYTRAGQFGVDKDGYVVNSSGMRLQGFQSDEDGNIGGVRDDIRVENANLQPSRTTNVQPLLNLDSSELVLEERGVRLTADGPRSGEIVAGTTNNLPAETWTMTYADGTTQSVTTAVGASAGAIAASLSSGLDGVDASASTRATISASGFTPAAGDTLTIEGISFAATTLTDLAIAINGSALGGITAVLSGDPTAGAGATNELRLDIIHNQGGDLTFQFNDGGAGTGAVSLGTVDDTTNVVTNAFTLNTGQPTGTVAGVVDIIIEEGSTLATAGTDIIQTFNGVAFRNNVFNPVDPETYNHSTSTTIYDSLGNAHVMTMYFVKQANNSTIQPNTWQMHALIDNQDIGDPVTGTDATRATYTLVFNDDGSLNENLSDKILISNWSPLDAAGKPNGADGPVNVADGGTLPIADPPESSNFEVDISGTTQYGSPFTVSNMVQNGFTTGRPVGLDVDESGILFARYTNGESRIISQIALASFNDVEGLSPAGDTAWLQTFQSGDPIIGAPGTGVLGTIQSSSVEDSNVDLSNELVNLIIAQRNYQANSKTIETANAVTQTIINLR